MKKYLIIFAVLASGSAQAGTVEACMQVCKDRGNTYAYGDWSPGPCACALQGQGCRSALKVYTQSRNGTINVADDTSSARGVKKNCQ